MTRIHDLLTIENYHDKIRRVIFWNKESNKNFIFYAFALTINPVIITGLYHNSLQIELLFKWIKHDIKIKKFCGIYENTVCIQIHSAIIAHRMMVIVQKR